MDQTKNPPFSRFYCIIRFLLNYCIKLNYLTLLSIEGRHKSRKYGRTEADLPKDDSILRLWVEAVRGLERPATSALEAYLLPNDDPRVMAAREAMAKKDSRDR